MPAFDIITSPDLVQLRLDQEVTIQDAAALHAALGPALASGRPLVIDAAGLTRLDTAALQLLLAAARTAPRTQLAAPSPALAACLERHALALPLSQP